MSPHRSTADEAVGSAARNKKRNAALSCAECRRLKLRCDRKFPCSACVKRGCSQICPEGSLTTGKGNRFVLANTEALHEKIAELSHRVRSLEDALQVAHKAISGEIHPLLSEELLKIKHPLEREVNAEPPKQTEEEDTIDAVGSLSISPSGRTNFYGTTANAWYLLKNEEDDEDLDEGGLNVTLPTDLPSLSSTFPFTPPLTEEGEEVLRAQLLEHLPDADAALRLVDIYFENAAWMYHPIARPQFDELIFARVYPPAASPVSEEDRDTGSYESHRLAIIYAVLAVGTLVDLSINSHSPQAVPYFQLAKAALSLDSVLDEPSIQAIQAMVIMAHYMFLNDVDAQRWTLMGIVVKMAQSIGLHRDSSRWNLSVHETQKRRELFWEIYVYDSWQSLTYGRPPSLAMSHIDCKMAHETITNDNAPVEMSFDAWKHRFSSECLSIIHDQVFGARTPSYGTIMELDKRVLSYYVPPSLQVPGFGGQSLYSIGQAEPPMALTMQRHIILAIKEVTLLYMHRGYFAQAMRDHPADPLSGKYGRSVLCAHRSASSFVALVKSLWSQHKALTERNWFLFTHVFSCAIVLGSIPCRCPNMALARSALQSFDHALELFESLGEKTRAGKVLPVLRRLHERAHSAVEDYQRQLREAAQGTKRESSQELLLVHGEDDINKLVGSTRLVSPKPQSPSSLRGSRSPMSSPQNSFRTPNSPPPVTPTTHMASPTIYTEPSPMQTYQTEHSPTYYQQSPEMALYNNMHYGPQNQTASSQPRMHLHAHQQFQQQQQQQSQQQQMEHTHWQPDPALAMGYQAVPMQTDSSQGSMVGNDQMLGLNTGMPVGQYGLSVNYDYMTGIDSAYAGHQVYAPTTQELMSPQVVDTQGAWDWMVTQFANTT